MESYIHTTVKYPWYLQVHSYFLQMWCLLHTLQRRVRRQVNFHSLLRACSRGPLLKDCSEKKTRLGLLGLQVTFSLSNCCVQFR